MKKALSLLSLTICLVMSAAAQTTPPAKPATPPPPTVASVLDRQLTSLERELVPLAEAMPADKYDFKPAGEGFKDVRMFKQQVGQIAIELEILAGSLLGDSPTFTDAEEFSGPANLKTKDDYVAYLKAAFAHAHKAIATINEKNQLEIIEVKQWKSKGARFGFATIMTWHSFDHYGQMVVYLRSNNIVPPASRQGN